MSRVKLQQSRCFRHAIFLCLGADFQKNPSGLIALDSDHLCRVVLVETDS